MRLLLHLLAWLCCTGLVQARLEELSWPALEARLPLWIPDSADRRPKEGWPAIVYYHGTNGQPTIDWIRRATSGNDYVLIGMTYEQRGRFLQSEEGIAAELDHLTKLRKVLTEAHEVDSSRIHVAGFSKGGWFASLLLERDRSLAGGMVLGAGVFHSRQSPGIKPFERDQPIYVGVGRRDGNYPQSLRALVHFRKLGAKVTLEAWPKTGHAYPAQLPVAMRQWLRLQATGQPGELSQEAREWKAQRLAEIPQIAEPVEQWYAWKAFLNAPYVKASKKEEGTAIALDRLSNLEKLPQVAAEKKWESELQAILRREMNDRYVTTLRRVRQRYLELSQKAEGTVAGELARDDAERTGKLLGEVPATEQER